MPQGNEIMWIVYPKIKSTKRKENLSAKREYYSNYRGYFGSRYMKIMKTQQRYFTTRSVYTRHKQLMQKYQYDYDPQGNQTLKFLKHKFSDILYKYLTMYGNQFYVKRKSRMDKVNFKIQNNFKLQKNPISKMIDILDRLNYVFAMVKVFRGIQSIIQLNRSNKNQKQAKLQKFVRKLNGSDYQCQSTTLQSSKQLNNWAALEETSQLNQLYANNQSEQQINRQSGQQRNEQQQRQLNQFKTKKYRKSNVKMNKLMNRYSNYKDYSPGWSHYQPTRKRHWENHLTTQITHNHLSKCNQHR